MRVTNITIGRLANLGNYEHVRYEVTVEIAAGESAGQAITNVESILEALCDRRPSHIAPPENIRHREAALAQLREMSDLDVQTKHGMSKAVAIGRAEKALAKDRAKSAAWEAMQAAARARFDNLGGTSKFTDHKRDWNDAQEDDYEW